MDRKLIHLFTLLPLVTAGCSLLSDLDSTQGGSVEQDAGVDSPIPANDAGVADVNVDSGPEASTTETCASLGKQCMGSAPAGWQGPVVVDDSKGAASPCGGDFPTSVLSTDVVFADLEPGTSSCACDCQPPTNASCSAAKVSGHIDASCNTSPLGQQNWSLSGSGCFTIPGSICLTTNLKVQASLQNADCTVQEDHTLPTPTWGTEIRACAGSTAGVCGETETCLPPAPAGAKVCIYAPGDAACPATGYVQKQVFHEGFSDTRSCSACSCGAPQGDCSASKVDVYAGSSGCTGSVTSSNKVGSCKKTSVCSLKYSEAKPNITCSPSSSTLSGGVEATGALTFCCMP